MRVSGLAAAIFSVTLAACGQAGDAGSLNLAEAHVAPRTTQTAQSPETAQPSGAEQAGSADNTPALQDPERDTGRSALYSSPALKAVASNDICRHILSRNSLLVGGHGLQSLPNTSRPRQGVATTEPTYGSCLVRLTNQSATRGRFHRNDYSRRQAFNANGSLMFLYAEDGFWHLYDAMTGKWLKVLKGLAGDAEPQWHPNNPHVIYFLPTNGVGMKIYKLDVIKNQVILVADMSRQIRSFWPDASTAWTRSEGSPSHSARYWCFMVESISGGQWRPRGVFTFDLTEKRIIATMNVRARPDHVSMSPSGNYCVVSGDDRTGTRAYRRDFKAPYNARVSTPYLQLHHKSEHSDLAYNRRREDVYVSIDYQSNRGDVFMVNLKTGEKTSLFPTYMNRTATAIHVSGKSFRKPGWVLISTYGEHHASTPWQNLRYSAARQWPHRKIFAVSLEKNPKIRSLAYTHSDALSYWTEPHATVNQDFTRILFNSTWNSTNARDMEAFMLAIPKNALDRPTR
ncbi:MAG: hypothetical protein Q4B17_00925 [Lautropia sp.]|nr:hypothetical protein [Lautropia sp.]